MAPYKRYAAKRRVATRGRRTQKMYTKRSARARYGMRSAGGAFRRRYVPGLGVSLKSKWKYTRGRFLPNSGQYMGPSRHLAVSASNGSGVGPSLKFFVGFKPALRAGPGGGMVSELQSAAKRRATSMAHQAASAEAVAVEVGLPDGNPMDSVILVRCTFQRYQDALSRIMAFHSAGVTGGFTMQDFMGRARMAGGASVLQEFIFRGMFLPKQERRAEDVVTAQEACDQLFVAMQIIP